MPTDYFLSKDIHSSLSLGDNWTKELATEPQESWAIVSVITGQATETDYSGTEAAPGASSWDGNWSGQLHITLGVNKVNARVGLAAYTTGGSLVEGPKWSDEGAFEIEVAQTYSLTWTGTSWSSAGSSHLLFLVFEWDNVDNHGENTINVRTGHDDTKASGTWVTAPWGALECSGAATFSSWSASGVAQAKRNASGSASAFSGFSATGAGDREVKPSGLASFSSWAATGTGGREVKPSGSATFSSWSASGTGTKEQSVSGTATFAAWNASGTAEKKKSCSGSATFSTWSATGSVQAARNASGSASFDAFSATGAGDRAVECSGSATYSAWSASGAGQAKRNVSGSASFSGFSAFGAGDREVKPSGAATFSDWAASGAGDREVKPSGSATFSAWSAAGAASRLVECSGAATFSAFSASGTGTKPSGGLPWSDDFEDEEQDDPPNMTEWDYYIAATHNDGACTFYVDVKAT